MPAMRRRTPRRGDPLTELSRHVDALIDENKTLKRRIAQLVRGQQDGRQTGLLALNRRLARLDLAPPARARGAQKPSRRVTDPVVLEKRRQALAKARAVRSEKLAAKRTAAALESAPS